MIVRNETDFEILKRAEDMLDTTFDWQIKDDEMTGIVREDFFEIIDELCTKIDELEEKIEDLENDIRDNYKPISLAEQYEVSNRDFI